MNVTVKIKLQEIRESKKLSIRTLAQLSGISKSEISGIETGTIMPTVYVACVLAAVLKVGIEELIMYTVCKCPT